MTPTKHDWDHVDFVGQDSSDTVRTREELQDFCNHLADHLVKTEKRLLILSKHKLKSKGRNYDADSSN
ncbi:lipase-like domain-containing protein [Staphylococcus aureus]